MTNQKIDALKKRYQAQAIVKKDFPFQDLFKISKETKKYQSDDGSVTLAVKGFASKYVPKYHKDNNQGYHTTIYLDDGKVTGCFSGALLELASFFFEAAGMDISAPFNSISFTGENLVKIRATEISLEGEKKTYNFQIIDGELDKGNVELIGNSTGGQALLSAGTDEEN